LPCGVTIESRAALHRRRYRRKFGIGQELHNLDYFSAMTDRTGLLQAELSEDDLHPNAKGYAIMAPLAEAAIARALK
jgi:acyl-CoA thioesterase I